MLIPLHRGVNLYRGTHGRTQGNGLEVASLDRSRTGTLQLFAKGEVVFDEAVDVEGLLADDAVDDAVAVHAVLDLAAFDLLDSPADVHRHSTALRVGHETPGTQDLAEPPDYAHLVRRGDRHVEVHEPFVPDAGGEVVGAHDVRACLFGLPGLLADGEDSYPPGLARAVREHQRAAHHLVRAPGVHVQVDVRLDALVELGAIETFKKLDGLARRVAPLGVYPALLLQKPLTHLL